MICECGTAAECDSDERYDESRGIALDTIVVNGKLCLECRAFTCTACADAAGPDYDPDLCRPCDSRYVTLHLN